MKPEFGRAQLDAQPILTIRTTATLDQMSTVMGPLFGELGAYIREKRTIAGRDAVSEVLRNGWE